jgi:hypothetical protein
MAGKKKIQNPCDWHVNVRDPWRSVPCGRESVVQESLDRDYFIECVEWHCKLHSQAERDKRRQKSRDAFEAKMAPLRYSAVAGKACKELGLTREELEAGKLREMVTGAVSRS